MNTSLHRSSAQDAVYRVLRQNIMNLNLQPGAEISEKDISERFNVSRTPVREAFINLSNEHLIQVVPQKRTAVSRIDFERVEQEFFLRDSLETAILEAFLKNCRDEHFAALEGFIEKQQMEFERANFIGLLENDDAFHRTFFEASGQILSWDVLNTMNGHYHRVRLLTIWFSGIAVDVVVQHRNILAALRNRNLSLAQRLFKQHVHKLGKEEAILRDEFPDFFLPRQKKSTLDIDFGGLSLNPGVVFRSGRTD
ncbi:MAG: GntR family transcriptional regulator [Spirochaetaceae bacterium]|jgi:DNA-binding GntR family transcriptional regulator|nr:GntR family transcriptional regulator [Spirochaetaceae bacterium]